MWTLIVSSCTAQSGDSDITEPQIIEASLSDIKAQVYRDHFPDLSPNKSPSRGGRDSPADKPRTRERRKTGASSLHITRGKES